MESHRRDRAVLIVVFCLAVLLRIGLVLANREANDDHMEVVARILAQGRLPHEADCWECYQPKLFHVVVARTIQALGLEGAGPDAQIQVAQWINLLAGVLALGVAWRLLRLFPARSPALASLAFALLALNPALVAIQSQATNDSLAILFSTLAVFSTYHFLQRHRIRDFLLLLLFVVLGISAKANTWVTAIAITLTLFVQAWKRPDWRTRTTFFVFAFLAGTLSLTIFNPLNQYLENYRAYGAPMVLPITPKALPRFSVETPICPVEQMHGCNPGILSVSDGLLTFKFVEMLEHPRIEAGNRDYPPHRTSLWSLLYGRAHSVTYNNFPPAWSTTGREGFGLTRAILLLALLPSLLLLAGAGIETVAVLRSAFGRDPAGIQARSFGLFALIFGGYLLFITFYAMEYRDYSFLKPIFLYPAMIVFPLLFVQAADVVYERILLGRRWLGRLFSGALSALLVLYAVEIVALILRILAQRGMS